MKQHMKDFAHLLLSYDVYWHDKEGKIFCVANWKDVKIEISEFNKSCENYLLKAFCQEYNVNYGELEKLMKD